MIIEYENALRRLILRIIGYQEDSDYKVSLERIEKWKEKREIESKKNNGLQFENRLIFYSDFYDLKTIVDKSWELFKPVLVEKKRFETFFSEVEKYRNCIAHGRNITYSQELLLKGIVSDLKNSITIYHNKNEMKEDYFIEIIKITDNLGNIWGSALDGLTTAATLRVGDEYELNIEANDPKNREIRYHLWTLDLKINIKQESNRFFLNIDNSMISKSLPIYVTAGTPKEQYKNEDTKSIILTVLPRE